MSDRISISGNVPADIAERLSDVAEAANESPDFSEPEDLADLLSKELRQPVADLFSTRDQIKLLQRSDAFRECVNAGKALEWMLRDLNALEEALKRLWEAA